MQSHLHKHNAWTEKPYRHICQEKEKGSFSRYNFQYFASSLYGMQFEYLIKDGAF